MNVHKSTIYSGQKVETTQMSSIDEGIIAFSGNHGYSFLMVHQTH